MTRTANHEKQSATQHPALLQCWGSLTWDDLNQWAGSRSVSRGRSYQRQGRVRNLSVGEDGRLLASVIGGDHYVVSVSRVVKGEKPGPIESRCTCPIGTNGCKHAVAVVTALLEALAEKIVLPIADDDDPRWAKLEGRALQTDGDDEEFDEDNRDFDEDEETTIEAPKRDKQAGRRTQTDWDQKIEEHIRGKSTDDLADLVLSLTQRFPELREEFRERIALSEGDVDRLVRQARRELRETTSQTAWRNHWDDEGHTPNYQPIKHRLERLSELGHHDEVVKLGRELIDRGMSQVEEAQDEGETASELAGCLSVVFEAVIPSSLSSHEKILYAIDAQLKDGYGILDEAADKVLEAAWKPADWSDVAGALSKRIAPAPNRTGDDLSHDFHRDRLTGWLLHALTEAGRENECLPIMEAEARATGSYERLVKHLIAISRFDDAERWAREGIEKTHEKYPGIAAWLAKSLCDVAEGRKQWDIVAAHCALDFLQRPSACGFNELINASRRAKCENQVRSSALKFLETGVSPVQVASSPKQQTKPTIAKDWPLPMPEYLLSMMRSRDSLRVAEPRPHFDVLLDMAIAEKRNDDVLHWYDKIEASRANSTNRWARYSGPGYADTVADAVASSHPKRALEIYERQLVEQTTHADFAAYEAAGSTLRKMRPVLKKLGRENDWNQLLSDIRLKHRNRPRFMEVLDRLDGRPILESQSTRTRKRR